MLIPGCWAVALSCDIGDCTCHPTTVRQFETPKYKEEVERLKTRIRELEKENDFYARLIEESNVNLLRSIKNGVKNIKKE